ncbi:hypothetical protein BDQ17DRAFT_1082476 [Cyathus striatus]|nr:hypothetical protein BDQ17DRAFT_1082476 [Cyathus striatus]
MVVVWSTLMLCLYKHYVQLWVWGEILGSALVLSLLNAPRYTTRTYRSESRLAPAPCCIFCDIGMERRNRDDDLRPSYLTNFTKPLRRNRISYAGMHALVDY